MAKYTATQPLCAPPIYMMARYMECRAVFMMGAAQYNRGSTQSHLMIGGPNGPQRLPVRLKKAGRRPINHHFLTDLPGDLAAWSKAMELAYAKAPHVEDLRGVLDYLHAQWQDYDGSPPLGDFNTDLTRHLLQLIANAGAAPVPVLKDAGMKEWYTAENNTSEWLARLPEDAPGCVEYIAGGPALQGYLQLGPFTERGLRVVQQDYAMDPYHTRWGLQGDATLSVLDALAWLGPRGTHDLLTGTRRDKQP